MPQEPDHEETATVGGLPVVFRLFAEQDDTDPEGNASAWGTVECPSCAFMPKEGAGYATGDETPAHPQGEYVGGLWRSHAPKRACPGSGEPLASSDAKYLKTIRDRLDSGDVWAWAYVRVVCVIEAPDGTTYEGEDGMGGCSYASEADFRGPGQAWHDMKAQAYRDARSTLAKAGEDAKEARRRARAAGRLLKRLPETLPATAGAS